MLTHQICQPPNRDLLCMYIPTCLTINGIFSDATHRLRKQTGYHVIKVKSSPIFEARVTVPAISHVQALLLLAAISLDTPTQYYDLHTATAS